MADLLIVALLLVALIGAYKLGQASQVVPRPRGRYVPPPGRDRIGL